MSSETGINIMGHIGMFGQQIRRFAVIILIGVIFVSIDILTGEPGQIWYEGCREALKDITLWQPVYNFRWEILHSLSLLVVGFSLGYWARKKQ